MVIASAEIEVPRLTTNPSRQSDQPFSAYRGLRVILRAWISESQGKIDHWFAESVNSTVLISYKRSENVLLTAEHFPPNRGHACIKHAGVVIRSVASATRGCRRNYQISHLASGSSDRIIYCSNEVNSSFSVAQGLTNITDIWRFSTRMIS